MRTWLRPEAPCVTSTRSGCGITSSHSQRPAKQRSMMSTPTTAWPASASWASQAACLDSDPELFFPIGPSGPALQQVTQAKAICARCPVRCDCLQFALATQQVHGVWGGTSEEERQLLRSLG
jgi:WhiB family redox-sensing transcriptional regulator